MAIANTPSLNASRRLVGTPEKLNALADGQNELSEAFAALQVLVRGLGFGEWIDTVDDRLPAPRLDHLQIATELARRAEREPSDREPVQVDVADVRSEEHTSELQSHSDLVCRLLLEKKKARTFG